MLGGRNRGQKEEYGMSSRFYATLIPMLRAVPETVAMAESILSVFKSLSLASAIFLT